MDFRRHSEWKDRHAVLSASKYHWLNYTDERLYEYVDNLQAAALGTRRHALAATLIELGQKLENTGQTLNLYVNDCIGHRMKPEQILFVSEYAFGTADAIGFRDKILRIFDLKTGTTPASGTQLLVYAAYFCIEYKIKPYDIDFDLRIYQNDEVVQIEVSQEQVIGTMLRVKELNALLTERMKEEV